MSALTENDPLIMKAYQEYQRFNSDPKIRSLIRQREMYLLDRQTEINRAEEKTRKAKEKARKAEEKARKAEEEKRKAEEKARKAEEEKRKAEEEKRKAEQKALKVEQKVIDAVRKFKLLGVDNETIAKAMGLSVGEVEGVVILG